MKLAPSGRKLDENGHQYRSRHRCDQSQAGCPWKAGRPAGPGSAAHGASRFSPDRVRRRSAGALRVPAHFRQPDPVHLRPVAGILQRGAGIGGGRHAGHGLGQPHHRQGAGAVLRKRIQSHRHHDGRVLPAHPDAVRDWRRELQICPAGGLQYSGLRPVGRMRGGHRFVPRPAGAAHGVLGGGSGRGGVHGKLRGADCGPLLGIRQERHDPRPAEGLQPGRNPARAVRRGGPQLQERHCEGPAGAGSGGADRRGFAERGRDRGHSRRLFARRRRPVRAAGICLVRGHRDGHPGSAGTAQTVHSGGSPAAPARERRHGAGHHAAFHRPRGAVARPRAGVRAASRQRPDSRLPGARHRLGFDQRGGDRRVRHGDSRRLPAHRGAPDRGRAAGPGGSGEQVGLAPGDSRGGHHRIGSRADRGVRGRRRGERRNHRAQDRAPSM